MIGPSRPVLALVGTLGPGRELAPLLALVGAGSDIVSWSRHKVDGQPAPAALFVTDVALLAGLPSVPTAAVVTDDAELDRAAAHDVEVALQPVRGRLDRGEDDLSDGGAVVVPRWGVDTRRNPVLPPLVRSRLRAHHGLTGRLLVEVNSAGPDGPASTSLALASAAVVTGHRLPLAMALGTPVVTFDEDIDRFGMRRGVEVEVAASTRAAEGLVAELAEDEPRAAARSRRARRFAEAHLDLRHPAMIVRRRLNLPDPAPTPTGPMEQMTRRLAEFQTPNSARIVTRAGVAVAGLHR